MYDITVATHYDIIMGNDIASDAHFDITMGNDVARDINSVSIDIVMSQWVMSLLYIHIMASQCIMMLLWTSFIMYSLLYAWLCYFIMVSME